MTSEDQPRATAPESAASDVSRAAPRPRFEDLPPAAQRALREAEERRRARDAATVTGPKEIAGRDGPEPIRYGDWEKKGLISDF